jgi:hypothetical protein
LKTVITELITRDTIITNEVAITREKEFKSVLKKTFDSPAGSLLYAPNYIERFLKLKKNTNRTND